MSNIVIYKWNNGIIKFVIFYRRDHILFYICVTINLRNYDNITIQLIHRDCLSFQTHFYNRDVTLICLINERKIFLFQTVEWTFFSLFEK